MTENSEEQKEENDENKKFLKKLVKKCDFDSKQLIQIPNVFDSSFIKMTDGKQIISDSEHVI